MNNDLISRSALLEALDKLYMAALRKTGSSVETIYELDHLSMLVKDVPSVDAEVVRHGRWRPYKQNVECSECHVKWAVDESIAVVYTSIKDMKYCPNCGAKMDGDVNATD